MQRPRSSGWREQSREPETLQEKHDLFKMHKKIKDMAGRHRKPQPGILRRFSNEILMGVEEKLKRWKVYVEELFNDGRPDQFPHAGRLNEASHSFLTKEVVRAIKLQKKGKAVGKEKVYAETLTLLIHREGTGLKLLTALFNTIYRVGKILSDWLFSVFVTLSKKTKATNCDDDRLNISPS